MLNSRKNRLRQLELKSELPSKEREQVEHYRKRVNLDKNILQQLTGATPKVTRHYLQEAGNHRDKRYQSLQARPPHTLTDSELQYLIRGSTENLFTDELETLNLYEREEQKILDTYTDEELIAMIIK